MLSALVKYTYHIHFLTCFLTLSLRLPSGDADKQNGDEESLDTMVAPIFREFVPPSDFVPTSFTKTQHTKDIERLRRSIRAMSASEDPNAHLPPEAIDGVWVKPHPGAQRVALFLNGVRGKYPEQELIRRECCRFVFFVPFIFVVKLHTAVSVGEVCSTISVHCPVSTPSKTPL